MRKGLPESDSRAQQGQKQGGAYGMVQGVE